MESRWHLPEELRVQWTRALGKTTKTQKQSAKDLARKLKVAASSLEVRLSAFKNGKPDGLKYFLGADERRMRLVAKEFGKSADDLHTLLTRLQGLDAGPPEGHIELPGFEREQTRPIDEAFFPAPISEVAVTLGDNIWSANSLDVDRLVGALARASLPWSLQIRGPARSGKTTLLGYLARRLEQAELSFETLDDAHDAPRARRTHDGNLLHVANQSATLPGMRVADVVITLRYLTAGEAHDYLGHLLSMIEAGAKDVPALGYELAHLFPTFESLGTLARAFYETGEWPDTPRACADLVLERWSRPLRYAGLEIAANALETIVFDALVWAPPEALGEDLVLRVDVGTLARRLGDDAPTLLADLTALGVLGRHRDRLIVHDRLLTSLVLGRALDHGTEPERWLERVVSAPMLWHVLGLARPDVCVRLVEQATPGLRARSLEAMTWLVASQNLGEGHVRWCRRLTFWWAHFERRPHTQTFVLGRAAQKRTDRSMRVAPLLLVARAAPRDLREPVDDLVLEELKRLSTLLASPLGSHDLELARAIVSPQSPEDVFEVVGSRRYLRQEELEQWWHEIGAPWLRENGHADFVVGLEPRVSLIPIDLGPVSEPMGCFGDIAVYGPTSPVLETPRAPRNSNTFELDARLLVRGPLLEILGPRLSDPAHHERTARVYELLLREHLGGMISVFELLRALWSRIPRKERSGFHARLELPPPSSWRLQTHVLTWLAREVVPAQERASLLYAQCEGGWEALASEELVTADDLLERALTYAGEPIDAQGRSADPNMNAMLSWLMSHADPSWLPTMLEKLSGYVDEAHLRSRTLHRLLIERPDLWLSCTPQLGVNEVRALGSILPSVPNKAIVSSGLRVIATAGEGLTHQVALLGLVILERSAEDLDTLLSQLDMHNELSAIVGAHANALPILEDDALFGVFETYCDRIFRECVWPPHGAWWQLLCDYHGELDLLEQIEDHPDEHMGRRLTCFLGVFRELEDAHFELLEREPLGTHFARSLCQCSRDLSRDHRPETIERALKSAQAEDEHFLFGCLPLPRAVALARERHDRGERAWWREFLSRTEPGGAQETIALLDWLMEEE